MIRTKQTINTFAGGIDQDTSYNKIQPTHYLDSENMRIISNDPANSGALVNVKGNELKLSFADGDVIIGYCKIRSNLTDVIKDSIVFFAYNASSPTSKIYLFEGDVFSASTTIDMDQEFPIYDGSLKYGYIYRNSDLGFTEDNFIKAEGRYESLDIRKIYWVDGLNNVRYMILDRVDAEDPVTVFDINPMAELPQASCDVIAGGAYTSGRVQHSYQLYIKNGAATTYAPLSPILNLTSNDGGTDSRTFSGNVLGENTGKGVQISITGLDTNYNRIRIVAAHYTEYLINPTIKIIGELDYSGDNIVFVDNGYTSYGTIPIEEFRLFGQVNYIADSIATKNNYLFFGDLTEDKWNPSWLDPDDADFWDSRAVRYRSGYSSSLIGSYDQGLITELTATIHDAGPAEISVEVTGLAALFGITAPDTLDDINSVTTSLISGSYVFGNYYNGDGDRLPFSCLYNDCTIALIGYAADTVNFTITKNSGNFFTDVDYIDTCRLAHTVFNYDWTDDSVGDKMALVKDTDVAKNTSIAVPDDPTVADDWDDAGWTTYLYDHDGINDYNDTDNDGASDHEFSFKYQSDGSTIGAEGPNILVSVSNEEMVIDETAASVGYAYVSSPYTDTPALSQNTSSQRTEVYRMYIVFFNTKMQYSNPQWICDFRMPSNDDADYETIITDGDTRVAVYLYPHVTIRHLPTDDNLYGWQIFRCERGSTDRSVMSTGVISACGKQTIGAFTDLISPYSSVSAPYCFIRAEDAVTSSEQIIEVISPEVCFNRNLKYVSGDKLRVDGRYDYFSGTWGTDAELRITTVTLGETTGSHASDVILYDVTDGKLQSYGVMNYPYVFPASQSLNSELYKHTLLTTSGLSTFYGNRGTSFIAVIDTNLVVNAAQTGFVYGSYIRNVFETQYGGNTYEARSFNQVIPYSPFVLITEDETICTSGDTHISMFAYLRSGAPDIDYDTDKPGIQEMVYIPCESSINCFYRLDEIQRYYDPTEVIYKLQETVEQGLVLEPTNYPLDLGDLYRYNSVYSKSGNAMTIQCKVFDSNTIEHSDVKVIATGKKINNEYYDSWTNLYTNNFIELDPKYGGIKNLFNFNNRLFAGQDKAIAVLAVNDRSVISDSNKIQLTLGTGTVLERYDYITNTSGFQNYFDMCLSEKSFYYFDRRNKIINMLTEQGENPISEVLGYRSFLKSYDVITTVKTGFDPIYKETFFYITDGTISKNSFYSEYTNSFIGKQSFVPDLMVNFNDQFYSITGDEMYLHNYGNLAEFYGTVYDSFVEDVINPNGNLVNIYDSLDLRVDIISDDGTFNELEQFNEIEISNNYQSTTKTIAFSGDDSDNDTAKSVIRKWRVLLLPDDSSDDFYRFVDTFVKIKLSRNNDDNKKIVVHDIITNYRETKN